MTDKIIDLDEIRSKKPKDKETIKLWNLANAIDRVILEAIQQGSLPQDVAGILANRIGELCGSIRRSTGASIVDQCVDLLKTQSERP